MRRTRRRITCRIWRCGTSSPGRRRRCRCRRTTSRRRVRSGGGRRSIIITSNISNTSSSRGLRVPARYRVRGRDEGGIMRIRGRTRRVRRTRCRVCIRLYWRRRRRNTRGRCIRILGWARDGGRGRRMGLGRRRRGVSRRGRGRRRRRGGV